MTEEQLKLRATTNNKSKNNKNKEDKEVKNGFTAGSVKTSPEQPFLFRTVELMKENESLKEQVVAAMNFAKQATTLVTLANNVMQEQRNMINDYKELIQALTTVGTKE